MTLPSLTIPIRKATTSRRRQYTFLHRVADRDRPKYQRIFLDTIAEFLRDMDRGAVIAAFVSRDPNAILRALDLDSLGDALRVKFEEALGSTMTEAAMVMENTLPATIAKDDDDGELRRRRRRPINVSRGMRFDALNPRAVSWAATESGRLIRQISEQQRTSVRRAISEAFTEGHPPRVSFQQVRQVVGLTERQGQRVLSFQRILREQGATVNGALEEGKRLADKIRRQRAFVISRTETINASMEGQIQLWNQAADRGLLNRDRTRKYWVVTPDDRLCVTCRSIPPANPDGVQLDEDFGTPLGPRPRPTVHPSCRCAVSIRVDRSGVRPPPRPIPPTATIPPVPAVALPTPPPAQGPTSRLEHVREILQEIHDRQPDGFVDEAQARMVGAQIWQEIVERTPNSSRVDALRIRNGVIREETNRAGPVLRTSDEVNEWRRLRAELEKNQDEIFFVQGPVIRRTLAELRPLGGVQATWAPHSSREVKTVVSQAFEFLPRDWLLRSKQGPLRGLMRGHRGYYEPTRGTLNLGSGTASEMLRVAFHELGHRFEDVVPGLQRLEAQFYRRRADDEPLEWLGPGYKRDEKYRRDQFEMSKYNGKWYGASNGQGEARFYELFSMGQEALFTGSFSLERDAELRDLVLGILAGI